MLVRYRRRRRHRWRSVVRTWLASRGWMQAAEEEPWFGTLQADVDDDQWDNVVHVDVDPEDHYSLGRQLASGSFGSVHIGMVKGSSTLVCNAKAGEMYAVKLVYLFHADHPSVLVGLPQVAQEEEMAHLRHEIDALRRCRHENITAIIDAYYTDMRVGIVMELCCGGDVVARLIRYHKEGRVFTEHDAAGVIRCACNALNYIHGLDIIHRDIKLDNLLYATPKADSLVKLVDFGLAFKCTNEVEGRQPVGTKRYMAPELCDVVGYGPVHRRTRGRCGHGVDMWALGIATYLLLFGEFPTFDPMDWSFDFPATADQDHPVAADDVSTKARDFIVRLLDRDKGSRMVADSALIHPWLSSCSPVAKSILWTDACPDRARRRIEGLVRARGYSEFATVVTKHDDWMQERRPSLSPLHRQFSSDSNLLLRFFSDCETISREDAMLAAG